MDESLVNQIVKLLVTAVRQSQTEGERIEAKLDQGDPEEEKLNQKQAASFLGVSQGTLISWKKKGMVPYYQLPGSSKVAFYKSQLRETVRRNPKILQSARN